MKFEEDYMKFGVGIERALLFAIACAIAAPAAAQTWPAQPVRLVVGFSPGGGVDFMGRLLSVKFTEQFRSSFVVENRAGAAGTIGSAYVAKAVPDGHTLLITPPEMALDVSLRLNLPYDAIRDFAPISQLTSGQFMLAAHPSVPVRTVKDLILLAKAQPGKLNYGSSGTGSINHLKGELLQSMTGIRWEHVPFKGVGPAIAAVMGGEIEFVLASTAALGQLVKAGKLRGIGVTGTKRFATLPDVPTISESGIPGYNVTGWYGLFAPAGTSADIVRRVHAETVRALNTQDAKEKLASTGNEPVASSPTEFARFLRTEIDKWAAVIKSGGIKKIK